MKCCLQGVYERGMLSEGWGTPPPCYAASTPNTKGVHKTLALNATEPAQEVADVQLAHKACELWGEKNNYKEKFTAMHIVVFEMQSKDTVTKFSHVSNDEQCAKLGPGYELSRVGHSHEISQQKQHTGNRDPKPVLAQCTVRKGCPTQPDDENT